jgi:hypothetical protein
MVSSGDEVDTALEHLLGRLPRQAKTTRGVFAVGDTGMDLVLLSKQRDATLESLSSRGSYDVPNDQEVQARAIYRRAEAFAFF